MFSDGIGASEKLAKLAHVTLDVLGRLCHVMSCHDTCVMSCVMFNVMSVYK